MTVSEASRKENKELHTDGPVGMNVFLVSRSGCMYSEWLSYPPRGKGVFKDLQTNHDFAEIWLETDGSAWYVNCSRNYRITTNPLENNRKQGELYHQCSYRITGSRESYLLYAEESMRNCSVYHNYSLSGSRSISIGRESTNDIVYNATMISRDHAKMGYDGHAWILIDDQSANGTFVNGRQIPAGSQVRLAMGDMVSIMGLQIIAGPGVLSINDGNPQIHISGSLVKLEPEKAGVIGAAEKEEKENKAEEEAKKAEEAESERYMRLMAEFQNFKRRVAREKSDIHAYANEKIVGELLPVLDNFERALDAEGGDLEAYAKGMQLIFEQLKTALENAGLEEINAMDETFDPNVHNAVMTDNLEDKEDGTITKVLQKGYKLKDKVIRPSMVAVNKK